MLHQLHCFNKFLRWKLRKETQMWPYVRRPKEKKRSMIKWKENRATFYLICIYYIQTYSIGTMTGTHNLKVGIVSTYNCAKENILFYKVHDIKIATSGLTWIDVYSKKIAQDRCTKSSHFFAINEKGGLISSISICQVSIPSILNMHFQTDMQPPV